MKTEDLITNLSANPRPNRWRRPTISVLTGGSLAFLVVLALTVSWLGVDITVPRADNHTLFATLMFAASVASLTYFVIRDFSVPGRPRRFPYSIILVPFGLMLVLAGHELSSHSWTSWSSHPGHTSWFTCLWQTGALSLPAFIVIAAFVRRLAPTQLRMAGFYVGLLSAALATMCYVLHAPEDGMAFAAVVYSASALIMALFGALLGPRVLRWT